jgi:predicted CXXCH cytochrome family protein
MKAWGCLAIVVLFFTGLCGAQQQGIIGSSHDLTTSSSRGVCYYCHAPHHVQPIQGLWSHKVTSSNYTFYDNKVSTTYQEGAPNMSLTTPTPSRLCLSCHDGSVALGEIQMANGSTSTWPTSIKDADSSNPSLETVGANADLTASHPFSFDSWVQDNDMRSELFSTPAHTGSPNVRLWNGRIECTTCHEPHRQNLDNIRQEFLSTDNAYSALCLDCHDVDSQTSVLYGWRTDPHATDTTSSYGSVGGYATVAQSACMSCHVPHGSGGYPLLRGDASTTCLNCHDSIYTWSHSTATLATAKVAFSGGSSALLSAQALSQTNVLAAQNDPSQFIHPFAPAPENASSRSSVMRQANGQSSANTSTREAKCWDCHNAHGGVTSTTPARNGVSAALKAQTASSGTTLPASLSRVSGVDKNGNNIKVANSEYEICFKCHADSPNQPQTTRGYSRYGYTPSRQVDSHNLRLDFTMAVSRHNVVGVRTGATSPAFRPAMLQFDGSTGRSLAAGNLTCTDCHNSNNAQKSGGKGSNGPHMSDFPHLLERRYDMNEPPVAASAPVTSLTVPPDGGDPLNGPFALCNKCHDVRQLLTTGDTVFRHHASHAVTAGISCAVCHGAHGVPGGDSAQHANLLNLDTALVGPDPATGRLEINTVTRTCYVSCHFSNAPATVHSGTKY